jgi:hypothetical protein
MRDLIGLDDVSTPRASVDMLPISLGMAFRCVHFASPKPSKKSCA